MSGIKMPQVGSLEDQRDAPIQYIDSCGEDGQDDLIDSGGGQDIKGNFADDSALQESKELAKDALQKGVTALYAKILVILGIAFPLSEVLSSDISPNYYRWFYIYLTMGSFFFLIFFYIDIKFFQRDVLLSLRRAGRNKNREIVCQNGNQDEDIKTPFANSFKFHYTQASKRLKSGLRYPLSGQLGKETNQLKDHRMTANYGSFYLRLGTILFGIGSLVHTGIEIGGIFDIENLEGDFRACGTTLSMIRPLLQLLFIFSQMYFIFLNQKMNIYKRKWISRLGLMHMIATNLCIWIKVVILETEHEIHHNKQVKNTIHALENISYNVHKDHGEEYINSSQDPHPKLTYIKCGSDIMQSVLKDSSPFLMPCTIEFSLICVAILYIMWKNVGLEHVHYKKVRKMVLNSSEIKSDKKRHQHYSVDCSHANTGLFCGIFIVVTTIISLILFFVFITNDDPDKKKIAIQVATLSELSLYSLTSLAVVVGMVQIRKLWYNAQQTIELDILLLIIAQAGVFIYASFSIVGTFFQFEEHMIAFFGSLLILIQTLLQTLFILDASCRFAITEQQVTQKPGRQVVTFLLVCNLAMWMINTLETSRADSHPIQAEFFGGDLAWPIITHISMPLAIFYRFHSTVCLFEIWKKSFKYSKNIKS